MLYNDWLKEVRGNVHSLIGAGNKPVEVLLTALALLGVTVAAEPIDSVETTVDSADGQQTLWLARVWVLLEEQDTSNSYREVYVGHSSQGLLPALKAAVGNALHDVFCS